MNWFSETFEAADKAGVTGIAAQRWVGSHAIAFWIEPKEVGHRFWEELERLAGRNHPDYFPPPTFYVFDMKYAEKDLGW